MEIKSIQKGWVFNEIVPNLVTEIIVKDIYRICFLLNYQTLPRLPGSRCKLC